MSIKPCRQKWKATLTDRQRFNNQMHYKPVDRCFNMEFGYWDENFQQWSIFVENGITNNDQADIFFNFDVIKHLPSSITSLVSDVLWMNPPFERKVVKETQTSKIMTDENGLLAEIPKDG